MKQIRSVRIELLRYEVKSSAEGIASPLLLVTTNLREAITQCVISGFASFLQRWIPLIEGYNFDVFIVYYTTKLGCVLEDFNCLCLVIES